MKVNRKQKCSCGLYEVYYSDIVFALPNKTAVVHSMIACYTIDRKEKTDGQSLDLQSDEHRSVIGSSLLGF